MELEQDHSDKTRSLFSEKKLEVVVQKIENLTEAECQTLLLIFQLIESGVLFLPTQ
jgi:hypothetical protein